MLFRSRSRRPATARARGGSGPPGGAAGALLAEPGVDLEGEGRSVFDRFRSAVGGVEPGVVPGASTTELTRGVGVEQPTPQEVGQTVGQQARRVLDATKTAARDIAARISGGTMTQAEGSETLDAVLDASTDRGLDELVDASLPRLFEMLRHGTTTCEVKSGYGLDVASELRLLRAIDALRSRCPLDIVEIGRAHV